MRSLALLATVLAFVLSATVASAQTPNETPTPLGTTNTPASQPTTATPAPTEKVSDTPTATAVPVGSGKFEVSSRLVEDANDNGLRDAADTTPAQAAAFLIPWAAVDSQVVIEVFTAPDGRFAFQNLPPGDYSLRLYWPAGFASKGASQTLPLILRAAFRITDDGTVTAPTPLPETWPGLGEKFDPVADNSIIGALPAEILLKRKDPNVVSIQPDSGVGVPSAVGSIDVAEALRRLGISRPQLLPSTGQGVDDVRWAWVSGAAILVGLALAAWFTRRSRSNHRR